MPGRARLRAALGLAAGMLLSTGAGAASERYQDERTGLDAWRWEGDGVRVQLVQRLPDQTRAFFLGRGFPRRAVERLAGQCVFQTIFTNLPEARAAAEVRLADWRFDAGQGPQALADKAAWQAVWAAEGVSQAARLAFQWALFPTYQVFEPGDWNMGMTVYPVPPGTAIDVHVAWQAGGDTRRARLEAVRCAPDIGIRGVRE